MNKGIVSLAPALTFLLLTTFIYNAQVTVEPTSATATISVNPPTSKAAVGLNFTISVNISDVVDLYGWEFKLGWNSTIVNVTEVTEGPLLKQGGSTSFTFKINNTAGYTLVDCTLLGNVTGVTGNGILADVKFYVKTKGESTLDLYDTILVSSLEQPITHTTIDGYYYTPTHDVAVIDLVASETTVNVTPENQGTETETFNVSASYTLLQQSDPPIGTQTVTLPAGANTTLTFPWTPPYRGLYEIKAEATSLPDEFDTADNTRTIRISITYVGSSQSNPPILNWAILAFGLISAVWIIPSKKRRKRAIHWSRYMLTFQWVTPTLDLLTGCLVVFPATPSKNTSNYIDPTTAQTYHSPNNIINAWHNPVNRQPV